MAIKRKMEALAVSRDSHAEAIDDGHSDGNDVFRKYFESVFEPLPEPKQRGEELSESSKDEFSEDESENSWEGFSDQQSSSPPTVQIIEHNIESASDANPRSNKEFKAFMNSRPPRDSRVVGDPKVEIASEDESETLNLKHDLDLQRLLKESHLLERGRSTADTTAIGPQRHRATDLRIQSLGAKGSLFDQEKMPMSHRKGIQGKKRMREGQRREEAKENDIVLEKKQRTGFKSGKRERAVDAPGVGKFRDGMLKLSKSDIAGMQGPSRSTSRRRGKR